MKKFFIIGFPCFAVLLLAYAYYYNMWKVLWELEYPSPIDTVFLHHDDTLCVIMIGDSWIEMYSKQKLDLELKRHICELTSHPVKVTSKGKVGKSSREIYDLKYKENGYSPKLLIVSRADYCVISAGINNASAIAYDYM